MVFECFLECLRRGENTYSGGGQQKQAVFQAGKEFCFAVLENNVRFVKQICWQHSRAKENKRQLPLKQVAGFINVGADDV